MNRTVRRARAAVVLLAIVSVVGVAWWQVDGPATRVGAAAESGVGVTRYPGDAGIPLPVIEGRTLDGTMLDLADLRGEVLVVNVWGSWCALCRAEAPTLAKISTESATRGVRFVGIDVRDDPAAARAFTREFGIGYPSLEDRNGLVLAQFTGILPVGAVPSTLVVDSSGVIRARVIGQVEATTLRGLIQDAERLP